MSSLFNELSFESPERLHLLWLVLLFVLTYLMLERLGATRFDRFISRKMQMRLIAKLAGWRKVSRLALFALAAIALVIAMMRPQWGLRVIESPKVGAQLMVCMDVSKSMLAEDVAPNRLERAKAEITDLLPYLEGDHVGLIAFAGKATVASPMTPDFGFFRLVLDNVGPNSVALGGTNLEAPLRKAIDGFRMEGDAARAIILVTDGEDHDSFPMDTAKAAAERGIRIIAIGFGDEAGSPIWTTDPETGARTKLTDSSGKPVNSRLDGELLRDLALETKGVYIPAGTGVLDLKSIYDAHLKPLTRSSMVSRRQIIRQDAYHWFILAGMLLILLASLISSHKPRIPASMAGLFLACGLTLMNAGSLSAEADSTDKSKPASEALTEEAQDSTAETADTNESSESEAKASEAEADMTPREIFNKGLAFFNQSEWDSAENRFQKARRESKADGELRYRTSFNLAWVEIKRGESLLTGEAKKPEAALQHLRRAADWFKDAIRLRPDDVTPRQNLEILQRRILTLADSLKQKQGDLKSRLDALIKQLREQLPPLIFLVEVAKHADTLDATMDKRLKQSFRDAATEQRLFNGELKGVMDQAWEEKNTLSAKKDLKPEEQYQIAQLSQLHHELNLANQKLAQARTQMRLRQAERAYRRKSSGLDYLKAARDQLRSPVERLQAITTDQNALLTQTQQVTRHQQHQNSLALDKKETAELPGWMNFPYLNQTQTVLLERARQLLSILDQVKQNSQAAQAGNVQAAQDPKQQRFMQAMADAHPAMKTAVDALTVAEASLSNEKGMAALAAQKEAMVSLTEAMTYFMDIKQLIEMIYQDQRRLEGFFTQVTAPAETEAASEERKENIQATLPAFNDLQAKNLDRLMRLRELVQEELKTLEAAPKPDASNPNNPNGPNDPNTQANQAQQAQQKQQMALAAKLIDDVDKDINLVLEGFTSLNSQLDDEKVQPTKDALKLTNEHLEALRRLFFTIIQHLQDALKQQVAINDEVQGISALHDESKTDESLQKLGPVMARQAQTKALTDQISQGLSQMAASGPGAGQSPQGAQGQAGKQQPPPHQHSANSSENFLKAADKTKQASEQMLEAASSLSPDANQKITFEAGLKAQTMAAQKLAEALAILQQDQNQNQDNQQQNQNQDQQQQGSDNKKQDQNKDQSQKQSGGMGHVLQGVRDREAKRRKDKQKALAPGGGVEKDW